LITPVSNFNAQLRRELRTNVTGPTENERYQRRELTAYVLGLSGLGLQTRTLMRGMGDFQRSDNIIHNNSAGLSDDRGGSRILYDTQPNQFKMGEPAFFAHLRRMGCEQTELKLRHLTRNLEATGQNTGPTYKRLTILSRRYTMIYGPK